MDFEFSKMLEEVLTWIVAHLDGPLWDATIVILLGTGLFLPLQQDLCSSVYSQQAFVKCGLVVRWREFINTFPSVYDRSCEPRWCG